VRETGVVEASETDDPMQWVTEVSVPVVAARTGRPPASAP